MDKKIVEIIQKMLKWMKKIVEINKNIVIKWTKKIVEINQNISNKRKNSSNEQKK